MATLKKNFQQLLARMEEMNEENFEKTMRYTTILLACQLGEREAPKASEWAAMSDKEKEDFFDKIVEEAEEQERWEQFKPMPKHKAGNNTKH